MRLAGVIALTCLVGMGCKGKQGDPGANGINGTGTIEVLTGAVISDSFTVTDSRFIRASQIVVYIGDSLSIAQLPYFLPGAGVNTYALLNTNTGQITITNAQLAGATRYIISMNLG